MQNLSAKIWHKKKHFGEIIQVYVRSWRGIPYKEPWWTNLLSDGPCIVLAPNSLGRAICIGPVEGNLRGGLFPMTTKIRGDHH